MTSKESFEILASVSAEKNPFDFSAEEWRTLTAAQKRARYAQQREWDRDHDKRIIQAVKNLVPEVGLGCTVFYYTDRHAATVTRVISPKEIAVRDNKVVCIDYYSGSYCILPEMEGKEQIFTKRKNGYWCEKGQPVDGSVRLTLHYQRHYIDPHF